MTDSAKAEQPFVLTVDDSKTNHKIVNKILAKMYKTHGVYSGRECLDYLGQNPAPDLILLDVTMPDLDGYQTCELLKADASYRQIPVLFLSGRCSIEEKLKGYEVGGDDYITKPFEEQELAAKIKKFIDVRRRSQKMNQRAEQAAEAVSQAIRVSSSINICMKFMGKLVAANTMEELSKYFFEAAKDLGVLTTLHIKSRPEGTTYFEDGIEKELEVALFKRLDSEDTFIPLGKRLIIQFCDAVLLVKNLPNVDEREEATLKNYLYTLLEGVHTRWKALQAEEGVRRQREVLGVTVVKAKEMVGQMAGNFEEIMKRSHDIFEEALGNVEQKLGEFGLNESQESLVINDLKQLLNKMDDMHSSLLEEDHNIQALSDDLEKVVHAMSKSIERDCGIAG